MQNATERNFILQQGFEEPAPTVCVIQYSALQFQPRIVLVWLLAGFASNLQPFSVPCVLLFGGVLCFQNLTRLMLCTTGPSADVPVRFASHLLRLLAEWPKQWPEHSLWHVRC